LSYWLKKTQKNDSITIKFGINIEKT